MKRASSASRISPERPISCPAGLKTAFGAIEPVWSSARAPAHAVSLHPEDLDALRTAVKSSKAANTIRAYQSQCVLFAHWLQSKGYPQPPWEAATPADRAPVSPMLVAAWLQERAARGDSKSTICVALAAVRHGHSITGTRFDRADPVFDEAMKGVRKNAVREEDQAAPLRGAMLADILTTTGATATLLEQRNAAMLATLYVLALRRSELAGLDYLVLLSFHSRHAPGWMKRV